MMQECLNLFLAFIADNPLMPSRLGKAAVGRIYNTLVRMLFVKSLSPEEMCSILGAVYCYMQNPDSVPEGCAGHEIFDELKAQIDKSAERSMKARQRAALRKAAREAVAAVPPVGEVCAAAEPAVETPEAEPVTEPEAEPAVEMPEVEPVAEPVVKPRRRREPDTIVSNYRPKKKPTLRYRVLTDEEMNAEPYDPFGAHRAYEIQCGRRRW